MHYTEGWRRDGRRKRNRWGGKPMFKHKRSRQPTWSGATMKRNEVEKKKYKRQEGDEAKSPCNHKMRWKDTSLKKVQGKKIDQVEERRNLLLQRKQTDSKQTHALSELNRSPSYLILIRLFYCKKMHNSLFAHKLWRPSHHDDQGHSLGNLI